MPERDLIVMGGSAVGHQALSTIVAELPDDFAACVLIVVHASAHSNGVLPPILARRTAPPVSFADDRTPLEHGRIFVARPDGQLLVMREGVRVTRGPRENGLDDGDRERSRPPNKSVRTKKRTRR
jgi:two-component system, chemotaxis family, protein-glutamate methylesterase/glutaminase